ncbi:gluconate:H+ symporter [Rubrolithibacter danxiaensis]|uniref:gluconate:H+ symporter n=1 Tax=Rubrolithibacter danxiaensis TaxID=3390805 RepID=UPI003BF7AE33
MSLIIILLSIILLVLLATWGKINPFLAFLIVSIVAGLCLGIPLNQVVASVEKGMGDTLGSLVIVICLGAMLGKLVANSGAAQKIAMVLVNAVGEKYIQWALMVTGFIIGLPLFYGIGFVLMVPLIFSIVYKYKLPAVYIGLPMLAALSVTHGYLPPHPSPVALVVQFNASMGLTLLYGMAIAIPAIIIAGPLFSKALKGINCEPLKIFQPDNLPEDRLPGTANSFLTALFPVILLMGTTVAAFFISPDTSLAGMISFVGNPSFVMILALALATFSLGTKQGKKMTEIMVVYGEAVKDVAMILLIIAGAGAFKQVLTDSGMSAQIGEKLQHLDLHPLVLGWTIAAIVRVCIGSATVAGLTTAGVIAPLIVQSHVDPNLMVLAVGAGSLAFSHVNDSGFWLFKEYFNLSIKDTIKSWSIMESIVSVVGLIGVLIFDFLLK